MSKRLKTSKRNMRLSQKRSKLVGLIANSFLPFLSCLSLIISIGVACQFLTAIAHSDQYQQYPSLILRAFSLDIRTFLQDAVVVLES